MARGLHEKEEKEARESRLQLAIANDDVDELHNLIGEEQQLLDRLSKDPFPNTPLHLAAAAGKTQVAMEIAILKPSFARKLNSEGHSPMHLALQYEHYNIVRALLNRDSKLIRVSGRCGITPLHYIAKKEGDDELELLAEFLCACKSSIEDLTSQCETAVHVAVKNHNINELKVLLGWLKRVDMTEILNWKDQDGNTVLHIAVSERQPEIIKLLIRHVKVHAKNLQHKTAVQMFQENPSGDQNLARRLRHKKDLAISRTLSQFLSKRRTPFEKFTSLFGLRDESVRDIILLVSTLVTTATYQAALTPPGGFWGDNSSNLPAHFTVVTVNASGIAVEKPHKAGNIIMSGSNLYEFMLFNSLIFLASVGTICITAIPLLPRALPVYVLMYTLSLAYLTTATVEFPKVDDVKGLLMSALYGIFLGVVWWTPLAWWLQYKANLCGIDGTGRRVGNFLELKNGK